MLRKTRIGISIVLWALITLYFLDFVGILPNRLHALAHIQFVPALLSLSIVIVLILVVLTLLFGRIYCSSICPLGTFQDVATALSKRLAKRKKHFKYSPAKTILRWAIVVVTILTFLCGFTTVLALLDPYSAYGRMVTSVFKPIYMQGNNLLESIFSRFDNYTFYQTDAAILSIITFITGVVTFLLIGFLAWKHGRTWCNTICPVGTVLGFLARFSWFKIRIDESKCTHCGICGTVCKASCLNSKEQMVDYSRCVDCFDCLGACKEQALVYARPLTSKAKTQEDASKRSFLLTGLTTFLVVPQIMAQARKVVAAVGNGKAYDKENPITPPGSINREHFQSHCTSCHLCVSKCPSHVLKPAFMDYGLGGMMQATVNFDKGFCNFDCTVCGDVCPTGAIKPLSIEKKHLTQMGYVVFIEENCIVHTDGTSCGACSEHCPTQAIAMVEYTNGLTIPKVNTAICVGCGGCEYVCPARPFRAVHIEGNPVQKEAQPFKEVKEEKVEIDGFGF